ncbi:hypothetical protein Bca4012_086027 [Brassica carinata]
MADATEKAEHDRIFKKFDANGDGKISATELGDALKNLGSATHDDIKRMMAEIDTMVMDTYPTKNFLISQVLIVVS